METNTPKPLDKSLSAFEQEKVPGKDTILGGIPRAPSVPGAGVSLPGALAVSGAIAAQGVAAVRAGQATADRERIIAEHEPKLVDGARPYEVRPTSRLVTGVLRGASGAKSAPIPGQAAVMSPRVMEGGGLGRTYMSAPQVTGVIQAPPVEQGTNVISQIEAPKSRVNCGDGALIAERTFRVRMPNGAVDIVHKGDIMTDPGAICWVEQQKCPVRKATVEEINDYFGYS